MAMLSTVEAFKHIAVNDDMIAVEGELLQRLQDELLVMLGDVIDVCDTNGIPYTLSGGTCLGAVRHGGFIPWDDDIDINIAREGIDLFVQKMREQHGDIYWVHHPMETHNLGLGLVRVRKKGTVVRGREDFDMPREQCGVPVDVFIIENTPDNAVLRLAHGTVSLALGLALSCRRFAAYGDEYLKLAGDNASARHVFKTKMALGKLASFKSIDGWCHAWYKWNALCKNNQSRYVSLAAGRKHYFGELHPRQVFFPAKEGRFEHLKVALPGNWDAYLRSIHGDYMEIPQETDREAHVVYELDLG